MIIITLLFVSVIIVLNKKLIADSKRVIEVNRLKLEKKSISNNHVSY